MSIPAGGPSGLPSENPSTFVFVSKDQRLFYEELKTGGADDYVNGLASKAFGEGNASIVTHQDEGDTYIFVISKEALNSSPELRDAVNDSAIAALDYLKPDERAAGSEAASVHPSKVPELPDVKPESRLAEGQNEKTTEIPPHKKETAKTLKYPVTQHVTRKPYELKEGEKLLETIQEGDEHVTYVTTKAAFDKVENSFEGQYDSPKYAAEQIFLDRIGAWEAKEEG